MKTEVVRVRLTEQEKILFQDRAANLNMSISDYIKYCCLINPPRSDFERTEPYGTEKA